MTNATRRQRLLLDELRAQNGPFTTADVRTINNDLGAPKKTTARNDIGCFFRQGLIHRCGSNGQRYYLLTRKAFT